MDEWERALKDASEPSETLGAFLGLAVHDMRNAAANIDCPFCRKHMVLEADELQMVLKSLDRMGNRNHAHSFGERIRAMLSSVNIVVNVLLGGLRRAGVI
jgi:hypothetical protein